MWPTEAEAGVVVMVRVFFWEGEEVRMAWERSGDEVGEEERGEAAFFFDAVGGVVGGG